MDDPHLDQTEHRRALAGLRRINMWCGPGRRLARELIDTAAARHVESLSVLDLGCGGGDLTCEIARLVTGKIELSISGWDLSPTAIDVARAKLARFEHNGHSNRLVGHLSIRFEVLNAFEATAQQFDVVYCSLFLHHFTDERAEELLKRMRSLARYRVIVDDLRRTGWGWWLAKIGCQILSRSPVVHFDGPQSVRAAFTESEAVHLARRAGLDGATVRTHWPQRFLLRWDATK